MSTNYTKSDAIVERHIRQQTILVPIMGTMEALDSLYTLNETSSLIWQAACAGKSETEIVEQLLAEYDIDPASALQDVQSTLANLVELGALHTS